MTLTVVKPGLQTTLQGAPYLGHRHLGMPAAGAADCLSLALANHLVGNAPDAIAVEITLDDVKLTVRHPIALALTGAAEFLRVGDEDRALHALVYAKPGDEIHIGPATQGCRSYLAVSGQIKALSLLGGGSTYLVAGLGGFKGRALQADDVIECKQAAISETTGKNTPDGLRPIISDRFIMRVTIGPELSSLSLDSQKMIFEKNCQVGARTNRMGLNLQGLALDQEDGSQMHSAPVFPGTIQCPPDGEPFLLGPDAQTTGGYPRIAQVIRADRHLIGQLHPGSEIQLVPVSNERATEIYRQKLSLLTPWLGAMSLW
ncbi:MAG: biotin-dependent carboxyltransferase family protein [Parasphingorhabdus sp.]|uniref:5-oxoprolinase subunit C family protein n=1 Tax=Parasphingorhabdus sp. TaxID=2709688 RepID=UPI003298ED76